MPSASQRSARQDQVHRPSTQTTTSSRTGGNAWRNALELVRMFLCTRTAPSAAMPQQYIQSTCKSMPQENWCVVV
jgi:hypothetical protein